MSNKHLLSKSSFANHFPQWFQRLSLTKEENWKHKSLNLNLSVQNLESSQHTQKKTEAKHQNGLKDHNKIAKLID